MSDEEIDALIAIDTIIDNFARHKREAYFSGFAADATFLFYTVPQRLESRAAYEAIWADWERNSGFQVQNCKSESRRIQVIGSTAIFSHDVDTTLILNGSVRDLKERESIIMERREGAWLGVHEHLSARPFEGED